MTERVVVITVPELQELVVAAVRRVLGENGSVETSPQLADELTTKEVMKLLNVKSPKTLWAWRKEQGFPAPRAFGKNSVRYRRYEVEAWRDARAASGPGAVTDRISPDRHTRRTRPATSTH